jgi:hypothetical protein
VPVEGRTVKDIAALRDEVRGMIVGELERLRSAKTD